MSDQNLVGTPYPPGTTPGRLITFGKYKGETIEELFFKDFAYLDWLVRETNLDWVRTYLQQLPRVFPDKIKIRCGENHHAGCKERKATRISVPVDRETGMGIVTPGAAYFWCSECDIYSAGAFRGIMEFSLRFSTVLALDQKNDRVGFYKILKKAYGIKRLTARTAGEVFWE